MHQARTLHTYLGTLPGLPVFNYMQSDRAQVAEDIVLDPLVRFVKSSTRRRRHWCGGFKADLRPTEGVGRCKAL